MARQKPKSPPKAFTLKQVYDLAMRDRKFLKAFLADQEGALEKKGRALSDEDLAALRAWLAKMPEIVWRELLDMMLTQTKAKIYPWP